MRNAAGGTASEQPPAVRILKVFIDFPVPFGYTIEVLRREPRYRKIEAWLSLVERSVRDAEAASSNLVASTYIRFTNQKS